LADIALANRLFAPHYAAAAPRIASERIELLSKPDDGSDSVGELQAGESFALLNVTGDWAWGYRASDHLVGYLKASALRLP